MIELIMWPEGEALLFGEAFHNTLSLLRASTITRMGWKTNTFINSTLAPVRFTARYYCILWSFSIGHSSVKQTAIFTAWLMHAAHNGGGHFWYSSTSAQVSSCARDWGAHVWTRGGTPTNAYCGIELVCWKQNQLQSQCHLYIRVALMKRPKLK